MLKLVKKLIRDRKIARLRARLLEIRFRLELQRDLVRPANA